MDLVVVLDPSGDEPERSCSVGQGRDAHVVALEGLHERLAHAVRLRAANGCEAWNQVQGRGEVACLRRDVAGAIVR